MRSEGETALYFEDATALTGLDVASPSTSEGPIALSARAAGGVAVGDVDQDGDQDLFVARAGQESLLLWNQQGASFVPGDDAGLTLSGQSVSGPLFFDYDADGWLDLFVGAIEGDAPRLFRNQGDGAFIDVTREAQLAFVGPTLSASAGDYDLDGYLDLFLSHWSYASGLCHLWHNDAGRRFHCAD
jgi:hypothetical protein